MSSHKDPKAFCIMWYACKCGHQERVWNSRDGVTPFGIICSSCGDFARHAAMNQDEYDPQYQLHHGQKFFRDGTFEESKILCKRRLTHLAHKTEDELTRADHAEIQAVANEFPPGWPCVDVYGKLAEY